MPEWSIKNQICPTGTAAHVPFATLTIPEPSTILGLLAVCFSLMPFFGILANVALIVSRRRPLEVGWLLFITYSGGLHLILKWIIRQPRPSSCLTSCGMPSGHSVFAVGCWAMLLWDCAIQAHHISENLRALRGLLLSALLLPVPWARIQTGDHSLQQAVAGSSLGFLCALSWIFYLWPRFEKYLPAHIFPPFSRPVTAAEHALAGPTVELANRSFENNLESQIS